MTEEQSLKTRAEDILVAVDHDLQEVEAQPPAVQDEVSTKANKIMNTIYKVVSDVDLEEAAARVNELKAADPEATREQLSKQLILNKAKSTATVGAVTAGAGLIPGVGTMAAITLGTAADIGATFKLQAELVLELAALYEYPLTQDEKQRIVMAITGLSAGTSTLARKAGQAAAVKVGEKFAFKSVMKVLPVVGVVASASTNVLSTYIIGQRADAYFRLGPDAVGTWQDSLRAITGVDERNIARLVAEGGKSTGATLALGVGKAGEMGKAAGGAVLVGAGTAAGAVGSGAKKAGQSAQRGIIAYVQWFIRLWKGIFRFIGKVFGFIWAAITFIPRKIAGLFRRKDRQ